ncbi:MAG TPA: tetratricopeptide repeat protein [Bryobacteraceae bacterium]|nr:tetratricopeptide repeat protein [Bryobacteraceae bacterium]
MTFRRLLLPAVLFSAGHLFAASKEIIELQRDVAQIQDQLRNLQRSQDEKLSALTVLVQQALDAANKANTSVAVLESGIRQNLKDQEKSVVAPVAGVGLKIDQMTTDFQSLRDSVADVSARMGKLQQQIIDLSNAMKTMQTPAAPPPPGGDAAAAGGAPPIPAETLYANAMRDRSGGKPQLALQEFSDYLKYYGNTDLAPNAQFYIGEIHYQQGDYDSAIQEFDTVLEKYPDNNKTADAMYMKGITLMKMGQRTKGAQELRELIRKFPSSNLSEKACNQVKAVGLSCTAPAARSAKSRKR